MDPQPTHRVELEVPPPPIDLQPIHDRISNTEQQVGDLRETVAQHTERLKTLAEHNPATEEALRLAQAAHDTAQAALKAANKLKNAAVDAPERVVAELPVPEIPPAPEDPPPEDPLPEPEPHAHRDPWWRHLL